VAGGGWRFAGPPGANVGSISSRIMDHIICLNALAYLDAWRTGCRQQSTRANKRAAMQRAKELRPILKSMEGQSARSIAAELNRRKIETPRGLKWSAVTVIRVQRRLGIE
jgi:hypothetical protein